MQDSRLLEILLLIMDRGMISAPKLAEHFDVSVRTIYRDIDALSAAGIPVYATTGRNGGVKLMDDFVLDKSVFTEEEKRELALGLQALLTVPFLGEGVGLKKLAVLFSQRTNWIDIDFSRWGNANGEDYKKFESIKDAVFQERCIKFQYMDAKGAGSKRRADPLKLVNKHGSWYLYGYCHMRLDFRMFKITRMHDLQILSQPYLQEYSQEQRDGHRNTELKQPEINMQLWFTHNVAHRIYDVFEFANIQNKQDGIYITVSIPENDWLYSFLLSFGADIRVIQPEHVKKKLKIKQKQAYEAGKKLI